MFKSFRRLSAVIVALLVAASVVFTFAQRFDGPSPWWLELSRYLPYPAYLAPSVIALAMSFWLGRWWLAASAAAVLLVATVTMDLHWHDPPANTDPGFVRVRLMTYNVKAYKAVERPDGLAELAAEVGLRNPDILVMQDAQAEGRPPFGTTGPIFGLPHVFVAQQYVVASRLPLLGCRIRRPVDSLVAYVTCKVDVGGSVLNLVTVHFESPRRGLNATRREGLDGAGDWQSNYAERLRESSALANELWEVPRPLVVAGDLNAPEASPVVRMLGQVGLRDAFSNAGKGYGYSYGHALRAGFSFLRIDHVLVSPDIELADCFVGSAEPSEHRPVIADLLIRR